MKQEYINGGKEQSFITVDFEKQLISVLITNDVEIGTYDKAYMRFYFDTHPDLEYIVKIKVTVEPRAASDSDTCKTK